MESFDGPVDVVVSSDHPSEEQKDLQDQIWLALSYGDEKALEQYREELLLLHPQDRQGVFILFEMISVLKSVSVLRGAKRKDQETIATLVQKSSYAQVMIDYMLKDPANKGFFDTFWTYLQSIANEAGLSRDFRAFRRNIISEVAATHASTAAGVLPRLPHPKDDVLSAVDLIIRGGTEFVQVKGSTIAEPFIIPSDDSHFVSDPKSLVELYPGIKSNTAKKFWAREFSKFAWKISQLEEKLSYKPLVHLAAVPYQSCSMLTGEPTEKLKEYFKEYFRNH